MSKKISISRTWAVFGAVVTTLSLSNIVNDVSDYVIQWYGIFQNLDNVYGWLKIQLEALLFVWWWPEFPRWVTDVLVVLAILLSSLQDEYGDTPFLWFEMIRPTKGDGIFSWIGPALFSPFFIAFLIVSGTRVLVVRHVFRVQVFDADPEDIETAKYFWRTIAVFVVALVINYQILARWWPEAL